MKRHVSKFFAATKDPEEDTFEFLEERLRECRLRDIPVTIGVDFKGSFAVLTVISQEEPIER